MMWRILHQFVLLDQTELLKRTKLYQRSQEKLLITKESIRFLCMVTRPHDNDWNDEKMKRERIKNIREANRPNIERVLIAFLKTRS